jgi:hypothetical protein
VTDIPQKRWQSRSISIVTQVKPIRSLSLGQVELHHGHHHYVFLVDGKRMLDPEAQGIGRDLNNDKVSLIAVS